MSPKSTKPAPAAKPAGAEPTAAAADVATAEALTSDEQGAQDAPADAAPTAAGEIDAAVFPPRPTLEQILSESRADIEADLARAKSGDSAAADHLRTWRAVAEQVLVLIPAGFGEAPSEEPYQPVGDVRVVAETDTGRVLEDDVRRWVEAK